MLDGEEKKTHRPLRSAVPPADGPSAGPAAAAAGPEVTGAAAAPGDGTTGPGVTPEANVQGGATDPKDGSTADPKGDGDDPATGTDAPGAGDSGDATAPATGRRRRIPFAHAVRLPPPRQTARAAVTATRAWSRRPSGRLVLPGLFLLVLVTVTALVGALLVPATVRTPRPAAQADPTGPATGWPDSGPSALTPGVPTGPVGGMTPPPGQFPGGPVAGRPADALAGWAQQTAQKLGIPVVAVQAYGYAELVLRNTTPSCGLTWTTLAAIGYVESRHGAANGAVLGADGQALPKIIGDPLDGQGGRMRIADTDRGVMDGDLVYDRAVGPMQFIPTTWQEIGADADNDGQKNPHDLDDAALAAGNYLCKGGRNLTIPGDWWNAILSYNDVRRYAQDVFDTANRYGVASRT
ncbi:lytic transglycosylase domain-containing protein [Micromonospora echinofusca]|uniref:Murein transglycosylase n=1 Tax=Micromonospora echinofusca TaxID=47858 RepID=A0ABS3VM11_MICEH|nr:lytic transglycosylase domain-containing protein [Micromonospora echinofusca]MBO4205473.1 murein transglycosylase [Micromonospora echinofusca]